MYYPNSGIKKYFVKVKGLSLNFITSNIVNFETMKLLIDDAIRYQKQCTEKYNNIEDKIGIDVPQKQIQVTKYLDIITKETTKKYHFVYDKRKIILEKYITLPFGYVDNSLEANYMPSA